MPRSSEDEINILCKYLLEFGDLSEREIAIGQACYHIGRCIREQEIIYNRKLFEEFDNDERRRKRKI